MVTQHNRKMKIHKHGFIVNKYYNINTTFIMSPTNYYTLAFSHPMSIIYFFDILVVLLYFLMFIFLLSLFLTHLPICNYGPTWNVGPILKGGGEHLMLFLWHMCVKQLWGGGRGRGVGLVIKFWIIFSPTILYNNFWHAHILATIYI